MVKLDKMYIQMYMEYMTTTELRTKKSKLVKILEKEGEVSLIHRSTIIGVIKPAANPVKFFDAEVFKKIANELNLPHTTPAQREKRYRSHLMKKYGKNISRH